MKRHDFWMRVNKTDSPTRTHGCWLWLGCVGTHGYGVFRGKNLAHRFAYEALVGPIPEGLTLDHICRNRLCVKPDHLEPVTNRENILRGEGFAARNARRTHCPHGHPYIGDNLIVKPTPCGGVGRWCRQCALAHLAKWRRKQGIPEGHHCTRKTHCKRGHPFHGENLRIRVRNGRETRVCRTCERG